MNNYHLTTPQQNIWNLQKYYPNTAIANLCGAAFYKEKRNNRNMQQKRYPFYILLPCGRPKRTAGDSQSSDSGCMDIWDDNGAAGKTEFFWKPVRCDGQLSECKDKYRGGDEMVFQRI